MSSDHFDELAARIKKLKEIFPDDERLRNAVLMAMGCCDQIPAMNEAFRNRLHALPAPGEGPVEWENLTNLALTDVLRWAGNIELALHDLRAALFYRYNLRVKAMEIPTEKQVKVVIEAIEQDLATTKPEPAQPIPIPVPPPPKPKSTNTPGTAVKIRSMFDITPEK